jgi:cellulose synthase/poly-beta-1,6-N-acetylglucosamine synthase-like glycosyltransferase
MNLFLQFVFWGAVTALLYSYLVYPRLVMWLASMKRSRKATALSDVGAPENAVQQLPKVTIIVAAFNEEKHIVSRIVNLLAQDYPAQLCTIFIGCDGCSDRTAELARSISEPRVTVFEFEVNRGKSSVLNDLVSRVTSEVIVFTDANTVFQPDTVRALVTSLSASIAATCGELILEAPAQGENQDHQYWNFERKLKAAESEIGGLLGANGGVYAIRKLAFVPLRTDTICDDFVIAMNIAASGQGLRYVPTAVAFEDTPGDVMAEYYRRVRIGIGNYQALVRQPNYLFGGGLSLSFTYFSHKVLRWLTPHLLLLIFISSVLLFHTTFYAAVALAQLLGYAFAVFAFMLRERIAWPRLVNAALFFAVLNFAFLVGFKRFLTSDYKGSWRRTERKE